MFFLRSDCVSVWPYLNPYTEEILKRTSAIEFILQSLIYLLRLCYKKEIQKAQYILDTYYEKED